MSHYKTASVSSLAQQLWQLGDINRNPPRLIARQQQGPFLAAREKRQGQKRLPGLILYDHH
jgi:hypothetical protein